MYLCYIWQTYSTGIIKIVVTNVEILEQTASLFDRNAVSKYSFPVAPGILVFSAFNI